MSVRGDFVAEVIKTYMQKVPPMRFIGKKYCDSERANGGFGVKWEEWFQKGWFGILEKIPGSESGYEDGDAYVGLMRCCKDEPFEYWVGVFRKSGSEVPEGFDFVDFDEGNLGVAWLYGKENEVYMLEHVCAQSCEENGYKIIPDKKGAYWFFERYVCPRFTKADEKGNIILDICHYVA